MDWVPWTWFLSYALKCLTRPSHSGHHNHVFCSLLTIFEKKEGRRQNGGSPAMTTYLDDVRASHGHARMRRKIRRTTSVTDGASRRGDPRSTPNARAAAEATTMSGFEPNPRDETASRPTARTTTTKPATRERTRRIANKKDLQNLKKN